MNAMIQKVPLNQGYLCFTPDTKPDEAATCFEKRFGYAPDEARLDKRLLWVGPICCQPATPGDSGDVIDAGGVGEGLG